MKSLELDPRHDFSEAARQLIARLDDDLRARYPEEGANHLRLDPEEIAPGRGVFVVARREGRALGCGAVRLNDPATAEIKRMFTLPESRGQGVALAVLCFLEEAARGLGARRVVLETGERQPEAIALYAKCGFVRIEPFGEYLGSPLSVCMEKALP
jgi:GNAT superfamily N-acetyltransferase